MNRRNWIKLIGLGSLYGAIEHGFISKTKILHTKPKIRKLKAVWTAECEQDLLCMYNIKPDE